MPVARLNGVNINYQVEGQGEPLVMIMGFSATRSGWIRQTPFFKKYYRVITFDSRGAGRSDKPPGPHSTRMMTDDTLGLMDLLRIEKAHVMGASIGGMIAQELAINYPERVMKLILDLCQSGRNKRRYSRTSHFTDSSSAFWPRSRRDSWELRSRQGLSNRAKLAGNTKTKARIHRKL